MKILKTIIVTIFSTLSVFAQSSITHCPEDLVPKYDKQKKLWGYANLFSQWVIEPTYTKVTPFVEDKAVVQKGLSYGVIACDGQVIVPNIFQNMTSYRAGKIWAVKNKLWGVLDDKGKVLLDFQYTEINPIVHTSLTWIKKNEVWGLFDEEKGRLLCQPQFVMATVMSPNATLVKVGELFGVVNHVNCNFLIAPEITKVKKIAKNIIVFKQKGKWGLFNEYGILRLNPDFDSLFMKYPETVVGIKNGKYGLYDLSGKETITPVYDSFGSLSDGLFTIIQNEDYGYATRQGKIIIKPEYQWGSEFDFKLAIVAKNNFWGVIDYTNKVKLPIQYTYIQRNKTGQFAIKEKDNLYYIYSENLSKSTLKGFDTVYINDNSKLTRVRQSGKISFVNTTNGTSSFALQFDNAEAFYNSFCKVSTSKVWGVIDTKGNKIIDTKYDSVLNTHWENKSLWVTWLGAKCGIIDTTGKQVFANEYDSICYVGNGIIKLKKNKLWGITKSNDLHITDFIYSYMSVASSIVMLPEWPSIVGINQKKGLIDESGTIIYPLTCDSIYYIGFKLYAAQKNNNSKIINDKGEIVSKNSYSMIKPIVNQWIPVHKGSKWGILNVNGIEIIKPQYQEIIIGTANFCFVKADQHWGIINKSGKIVSPFEYDDVENSDGKFYLIKKGTKYSVDKLGSVLPK